MEMVVKSGATERSAFYSRFRYDIGHTRLDRDGWCVLFVFGRCGLLNNLIYLKSCFGARPIHFGRQMRQFVQFEIVQPRQTLVLRVILLWRCNEYQSNAIYEISSRFVFPELNKMAKMW